MNCWRTVKHPEKTTLRLHSITLLPVGLYWHSVSKSNLVKRIFGLVQHSYFFLYFVRFRYPPQIRQPPKIPSDWNDFAMMIICSILISSTKPSVPCILFSYPTTKIQIHIFSLCLIIIISSHCLGVSASQTEHGGNAAAKAMSNNQACSQIHVQVIQVQSTPKDFPINMKAQAFTKILGLTLPIQLSICIPAFPGSRQNCHYLVYYSHRRASWSIHMVQGSQVKIAVGTFTFSFGGFDYVDFECIYASCLLLLLMILIPLES